MKTNMQNLKDVIGNAVQNYINEEFSERGENIILNILENEELHEDDIRTILSDIVITYVNHNMPGYLPDNGPSGIYASPETYSDEIREALLNEVTNLIEDDDNITEEQYNEIVSEVENMTKDDLSDSFSFDLPNNYVIEFEKVSALEILNDCDIDWASTAIENQSEFQKP